MSLADIPLDKDTRRRIRRRYREQMRKWAPELVQSHAPLATKGLMILMTQFWERRVGRPRSELHFPRRRLPRRRRSRWRRGGYGVYDLRVLRSFGRWISRVESELRGEVGESGGVCLCVREGVVNRKSPYTPIPIPIQQHTCAPSQTHTPHQGGGEGAS